MRGVALASAVALAACSHAPPASSDACAKLDDDLAACTGGSSARLDCASTSDVDVERLRAAVDAVGCEALATSLPLDGDPRAFECKVLGAGCVAPVTAAPERLPTLYPIVLVNGIDTSPLFRWSERIQRVLREEGGQTVFLATLPPYEPPARRAPLLWERVREVRAQTGAAKVNLVCHSLGGLDCRYLASPGGLGADRPDERDAIAASIASITTVGTAHRGTRAADAVLGLLPDGDRGAAIDAFAGLLGGWFGEASVEGGDPHLREALLALSTHQAPAFDAEIVDAQGVYYQSWAGVSRPFGEASASFDAAVLEACRTSDGADGRLGFVRTDWMALPLVPLSREVGGDDAPSDGLTPVASAKWGNFRGCVPADHMEQLGQKNLPDANVENGFDVARFYARVAADLSRRGL